MNTITLTESAANKVRTAIEQHAGAVGLRLAVKNSGCSGYMYVVEFTDEIGENDQVFESQGLKIVVDKDSLAFVDGTEIDYGLQGLNEAFIFNNPNEKNACGCGESFTV